MTDPEFAPLFLAATDKRPAEELYDIQKDPDCMHNLAGISGFRSIQEQLSRQLVSMLKASGEPREAGPDPEIWEAYPRLNGAIRNFPPETKN